MEHAGIERNGLIYVPESYDGSTLFSLVFALHGNGGNADSFHSTGFNEHAEELHFIMIYPNGYKGSWEIGPGYDAGVDDIGFFKEMISSFSSQYSIDPDRVYITGHSLGAFMTYRLGKSLTDELSAIAPVSGLSTYAKGSREGVNPLSVMHVHAIDDPIIPFEGSMDWTFPSVEESLRFWKEVNSTQESPENYFTISGVMSGLLWPSKDSLYDVALLRYERGGHSWPEGATDRIVHFFYNHPPREHSLESDLEGRKEL